MKEIKVLLSTNREVEAEEMAEELHYLFNYTVC